MAKKFKKQTTSTSFSLSRLFSRISTMQPSTFTITVVVMGAALFLFGGGIWTVISYQTIQPAGYYQNMFYFIAPGLSDQFISDTVVSMALYGMGLIGMLAIYQSTKYAYKPRQAYMTLVVGVSLLLLAYIFLENVVLWKASF